MQFHSRVLRLGAGPAAWSLAPAGADLEAPAKAASSAGPPGYVPDPSYWETGVEAFKRAL